MKDGHFQLGSLLTLIFAVIAVLICLDRNQRTDIIRKVIYCILAFIFNIFYIIYTYLVPVEHQEKD